MFLKIMDKNLKEYLDKNEIKYQIFNHPAVFTVDESRKIKQQIPGMHCKCLFLKDNKGIFYLIGMPAEKRLNSKIFRNRINAKKARFGTPEELQEKVNLIPGSVSIFGAIYIKDKKTVLVLDKQVWQAKEVGFHPNVNTRTIVLKHEDLKKYYYSLSCKKEILEL